MDRTSPLDLLDAEPRTIVFETPRFHAGVETDFGERGIGLPTGVSGAIESEGSYSFGGTVCQRAIKATVESLNGADRIPDEFAIIHIKKTAGQFRMGIAEPGYPIHAFCNQLRFPQGGLVFFLGTGAGKHLAQCFGKANR